MLRFFFKFIDDFFLASFRFCNILFRFCCVSFRFVSFCFILFRFCFVSFHFVSFLLVSFRFLSVSFLVLQSLLDDNVLAYVLVAYWHEILYNIRRNHVRLFWIFIFRLYSVFITYEYMRFSYYYILKIITNNMIFGNPQDVLT